MRIHTILGHSFAPALLKSANLALDCGANHGEFSRWLSENTPARIHAFEPDPRLFRALPVLPRVTCHPLAVEDVSGEIELALGEASCSSAVFRENRGQDTIRVKAISLDDFCRQHGYQRVDFIKIDIEGAELSLLEKTSDRLLQNTTQITVEFHDFIRKADTPRIGAISTRLKALGFYAVRFSHFAWSDCWFLNTRIVPISLLDRAAVQVAGRLLPGIRRFVTRRLAKNR